MGYINNSLMGQDVLGTSQDKEIVDMNPNETSLLGPSYVNNVSLGEL